MKSSPISLGLAIFLVLAGIAYAGFFLSLSNVPFMDAPDHLARAVIIRSLWFDPHSPFQGTFSASRLFMPYMLPDLGLMLVVQMLGLPSAYPVWSTLTLLALALAIWFYARQLLATSWAAAAAILCSWYFATNSLFIMGFFAFQWGLAAAFVALGAVETWRRTKVRGWIVLYALACFVAYGAHIACFAILAGLIGAIGLIRVLHKQQRWVQLAGELLPFAALVGYHLLVVSAHPEAKALHGAMTHSSISNKIGRFVGSMFFRQSYAVDGTLLTLFIGIVVGALWVAIRRRVDPRNSWELATVCVLAVTGYFLLPGGLGAGFFVDERLLPFFYIPLLMIALRTLESSGPGRKTIAFLIIACCLLAAGNLASLAYLLPRQNREVGQYRAALSSIPKGRIVFPIDTRRPAGRARPLRHAGSLYLADRGGYTPYLPSGRPAGYFLDTSPIYRPEQSWYLDDKMPYWREVTQSYDYVIITKPWRAERIDLSRLELCYENAVATVFRVRGVE